MNNQGNTLESTPESTSKIHARPLSEGVEMLRQKFEARRVSSQTEYDGICAEGNYKDPDKALKSTWANENILLAIEELRKFISPDGCSTDEQLNSDSVTELLSGYKMYKGKEHANNAVIITLAILLNSFHVRCSQCSNTECGERRE